MLNKIIVTVIFYFFTLPAHAEDLYSLYKNSSSKKPYVTFLARSGVPGHSFVSLGEELDNGLLFQKGTYGFYPKKDGLVEIVKLLFSSSRPGTINFKLDDLENDVAYRVSIDYDQLVKAEGVLKAWGDKKYTLYGNNCSTFASEVAKAVGLKLPSNKLFLRAAKEIGLKNKKILAYLEKSVSAYAEIIAPGKLPPVLYMHALKKANN